MRESDLLGRPLRIEDGGVGATGRTTITDYRHLIIKNDARLMSAPPWPDPNFQAAMLMVVREADALREEKRKLDVIREIFSSR